MGLLPGCVASFRADGAERISRGRRDSPGPGRARRAVFLSRWPIHKTPLLPSPRGTGPGLVFPTPGVHFSQGGEEEHRQLKRRPEPGSPGPTGALSVGAGAPESMAGLCGAQVRPGAIICRGCLASSGADTKGAPAQAPRLCPSVLVTAAAHLGAQGTWGPRDGLGPACLDLPLRPASPLTQGLISKVKQGRQVVFESP